MAFGADPACDGLTVNKFEQFWVVLHLITTEHDAVSCLPCVHDLGIDSSLAKELVANNRFDAISSEEHVTFDSVWLATFARDGLERWGGTVRNDRVNGSGEEEVDGFLLLAALIDRVGQVRPVADHVRVGVGLANVVQINVSELLVCRTLYSAGQLVCSHCMYVCSNTNV